MSLTLENAVVGYRSRPLIAAVNVLIKRSDVIFISGANGSGKSTLAKSLLGVLPLLSGRRKSAFARMAYVPQSSHFEVQYPVTVTELVEQGLPAPLPVQSWRMSARRKRSERVAAIISELGLTLCAGLLLRELSGGQLQRALIARALVGQPDFLLLDEPFSNLDRSGRGETAALLHQYAKSGATLCIIDHGDAMEGIFYNRVWEIDQGHLLEEANRR